MLKLENLICNLNLSEIIEKLIVFDHQKASKSGLPVVSSFQPILGSRVFFKPRGANSENGEIRSNFFRSEQRWWASDGYGYQTLLCSAMPGRRVIQSHTNMGRNSLGNIENLWSSPVKTMWMKIPEVFFHEYVREHTEHTEISIWIAVVHQSELRWFGDDPWCLPLKNPFLMKPAPATPGKILSQKPQHLGDPPWVTLLFCC